MNENGIKNITIFDTTLRDGQQCPGAGMIFEHNIQYAHIIAQAMNGGNHVIEAGFPSASSTDFEIVKTICEEISGTEGSPKIAGLCQLKEDQVIRTIEALEPGINKGKALLHTYFPVDPVLLAASIGLEHGDTQKKMKAVEEVFKLCKLAKDSGVHIEFSPEGYSRLIHRGMDNFDFTTELIIAAVEGGARMINCPDTIGGAHSFEGENYFVNWMNRHSEIIRTKFTDIDVNWSCHCHNDFGQAVTNSINAVYQGPATQIECTINGVGERAGNANMQEILMIINHFGSKNGIYTKFDLSMLQKLANFISTHMLPQQPHSPITGINSARHSSGGHTNALIKDPTVYQPFDPKTVGSQISLLFGPLSGSNHAISIIKQNGYKCPNNEKTTINQFIKDYYADRRKGVTDEEVMIGFFEYVRKQIPIQPTEINESDIDGKPRIIIRGKFYDQDGLDHTITDNENSALAALKDALDKKFPGYHVGKPEYEAESGKGVNASSKFTIEIRNGKSYIGEGVDQNTMKAMMKALIDGYNKAYIDQKYGVKKQDINTKKRKTY